MKSPGKFGDSFSSSHQKEKILKSPVGKADTGLKPPAQRPRKTTLRADAANKNKKTISVDANYN